MHHHLEFKCDAAVTTTVYDVLLDDQMMTMYSSIYNNAGTKTGCEVAFVIVYNFFRKLASTLNTVVPALPGDAGGIEEQLSPAMINSLTQPHNLTVELAKRRMTSLKKRKTVAYKLLKRHGSQWACVALHRTLTMIRCSYSRMYISGTIAYGTCI